MNDDFFMVLLVILKCDEEALLRKTMKYEDQSTDVTIVCKK